MRINGTKRVCHLTSAHNSEDTRIFHKQCVSLANKGYDVYIVSHGESYVKSNVNIVGVGPSKSSRILRIVSSTYKVYKAAKKLKADIYHIHDPELLPYALKLKKNGAKVIFDSHEDYLSTIPEKKYLPKFSKMIIASLFNKFERYVIKNIDGAITCYHWTQARYKKVNENVKMILNFPIVSKNKIVSRNEESRKIAFAGGISPQWNHQRIIKSLNSVRDVEYELAGRVISEEYEWKLKKLPGWKNVNYHGVLSFEKVQNDIYEESGIGICLLDYIPQTKGKVGNLSNTKFFEIMYMGLPIICTDFDLWKNIIREEKCGIYVNPRNVDEITIAINYLLDNKNEATQMGKRGHAAILEKYNWDIEKEKLFKFYAEIL